MKSLDKKASLIMNYFNSITKDEYTKAVFKNKLSTTVALLIYLRKTITLSDLMLLIDSNLGSSINLKRCIKSFKDKDIIKQTDDVDDRRKKMLSFTTRGQKIISVMLSHEIWSCIKEK